MKVTLIGPVYPYRGGIAHYTGMLARALDGAGHTMQVISFHRQYPTLLYPGKTDKDPSKKPLETKAEFLLDPLYPWTWRRTIQAVCSFSPEITIVQWWTTFWAPAFAYLAKRLKHNKLSSVYIIHNVMPHEQRPWDRFIARLALSNGDAFVVQTRRERERLQALLPNAQIYFCPLPTYHLLRAEESKRAQARRLLELPEEAFILLFFGFIRPYKGVQILLEALGKLRARGKMPTLVIAGEFWQDKQIYWAQIKRLGLQEQVRIEDRYIPDEEIGNWFTAADCLVAPYIGGTQSAAVSIALAYGLPMIVTQNVAEGISEENLSLLAAVVPPGDVNALAEAIDAAVDHPPQRQDPQHPETNGWERLVKTLEQIASDLAAKDTAL
jgi:glycosyltransferase involved in cell wall biosynthesis